MKRKKFNIEYQKRIYSGKYKTIISQENVKTLLVEPELEKVFCPKIFIRFIN